MLTFNNEVGQAMFGSIALVQGSEYYNSRACLAVLFNAALLIRGDANQFRRGDIARAAIEMADDMLSELGIVNPDTV